MGVDLGSLDAVFMRTMQQKKRNIAMKLREKGMKNL